MSDKKKYWFPARSYGWGWGLPTVWKGWVAYGIAAILLVAGFIFFPPLVYAALFQVYVFGVLLLLVAVCWIKGEPPSWRWGNRR